MKKHYSSIISTLFGYFANKEFSPFFQKLINKSYVKLMGLDMSEFKNPIEYKSLNKLFTRKLLQARNFDKNNSSPISPTDSLITDYGKIIKGKAYQIKGMEYNISSLFGENYKKDISFLENGYFINFYLAPKDYHCFHSPLALNIKSLTHISGKLYPVNFPLLKNKKNLFIQNERIIIKAKDNKNNLYIILCVAALNVGKMVITFEKNIKTNSKIREPQLYTYENVSLEKGELFGWFEMGSTILLFSQKEAFIPSIKINQKIKYGDLL